MRGPFTRERFQELGYPCPEVYGDPAILMPLYYTPRRTPGRPLAMVPHYVHLEEARRLYGADEAISIVDVTSPVESVIDAIASAEAVISSSLHGVIVAHAYGRPAALGRFSRGLAGDGVKFEDYFSSGGVAGPVRSLDLTSPTPADAIRAYIEAAPSPDLESLRPALLDACPF